MLTNLQLSNYFEDMVSHLDLVHHFYNHVNVYVENKANHSLNELSLALEPFAWMPKGVHDDNGRRVIECVFTLWCAIEDKTNPVDRSNGETLLMAACDQIYAKIIEDSENWDPTYDFVRYTDPNSFEFDPIEWKDAHDNSVGIRCEFELHAAPNFQIDQNVWS